MDKRKEKTIHSSHFFRMHAADSEPAAVQLLRV